jgi:hypothetical protein
MLRKAGIALAFLAVPAAMVSAAVILFVSGYSYQTAAGAAGAPGQPSTTVTSSGRVTTLQMALDSKDYIVLWWVAFVVVAAAGAAGAAWRRRLDIVWVAALGVTTLAVAGMLSVGIAIAPVAFLMLVSAILLTLDRLSRQISGDPFDDDQPDQDPPPTDGPH